MNQRPTGPLEEGDQALMDAIDATAQSEFKTPHKGIHKPFSVLSKSVNPLGVQTVKSTHFHKRQPLKRKRPYEGVKAEISEDGIALELRYAPDDSSQTIGKDMQVAAVKGDEIRFGGSHFRSRNEAQAIKMEAARKLEVVHQHLGEVGIKATTS